MSHTPTPICGESVRNRGRGVYGSHLCGRPVFMSCLCKVHYAAHERAASKLATLSALANAKYNKTEQA